MVRWRFANLWVFFVCVLLSTESSARASEYHGQITFGGFPVPGATVAATQGEKKFSVVSDQGGVYSFADLPDGHGRSRSRCSASRSSTPR